jgi:hypothetical protein
MCEEVKSNTSRASFNKKEGLSEENSALTRKKK